MIKRLLMTAFLAGATLAPSIAQQGPGMGMGQGPEGVRQREPRPARVQLFERLNLTDKQKEEMQKMRFDLQKKQTALQAKVRLAQIDIRELFSADKPDQNAITKKMKEVSDLRYQEKVNHVEHLFAVRAILTADQQKIWKEHMQFSAAGFREERMRERGARIERRIEQRMERRFEE